MSNTEHAFENCLFRFARDGEWPDIKKNDPINASGLNNKTIDTIEICATYIISSLAFGQQDIMNHILHY